jgi:hypothetical protein
MLQDLSQLPVGALLVEGRADCDNVSAESQELQHCSTQHINKVAQTLLLCTGVSKCILAASACCAFCLLLKRKQSA